MKANFWSNFDREPNTNIKLNIKKFDKPVFSQKTNKQEHRMWTDINYVVIWHGKIKKSSNRKNATKRVTIKFCKMGSDFEFTLDLPPELVLSMPIGSIWRNHKCVANIILPEYTVVLQDGLFKEFNNSDFTKSLISDFNAEQKRAFYEKSDNEQKEILNKLALEQNQSYALPLLDYPLSYIQHDGHTLLVIPKNEYHPNIIIHPITFFYSHLGVSKEINRILLNYPWGHDNNPNVRTVTNLLHLNYYNENCPEAVFLSDRMNIGDATFLFHLRKSKKEGVGIDNEIYVNNTFNRIKKLNANISSQLNDKGYAYLQVEPYHSQPIEMVIKGITLNKDTVLCTQITDISEPFGEEVFYDVKGSINTNTKADKSSDDIRQSVKLISKSISSDEIVLSDENVNNLTRAIIIQKPRAIGKLRKITKNEEIPFDQRAKTGRVIPINEPIPEKFGFGEAHGHGGVIGYLHSVIGETAMDEQEEQKIDENNLSQYATLLKHAQKLKKSYPVAEVEIDCFTYNNGFQGEIVRTMTCRAIRPFPQTFFILRIRIREQVYYFVDFESMENYSASGHVFKTEDEDEFLSKDNPFGIHQLIKRLVGNLGRFSQNYKNILKENNVIFSKYKHSASNNSNWIRKGRMNVDAVEL